MSDTPAGRVRPALVSVGGLPATGKTTVARAVATRRGAAYLRVNTVETAIAAAEGEHESSNGWHAAPGYRVGEAVAADQLRVGLDVVVESVNAYATTRDGWRRVAQEQGARLLEVEIVCSDPAEHRRRAEQREVDIVGLTPPTWEQILDREYAPWDREPLVIDTAVLDPETAAQAIEDALEEGLM